MKFSTAINCIDGRIQLPVIHFLRNRFDGGWIDMITEAGPCRLLSAQTCPGTVGSILKRLEISVNVHNSREVAIVGHHDCAVNPASKAEQCNQIYRSIEFLRQHFPQPEYIGVWVDEFWHAWEVDLDMYRE